MEAAVQEMKGRELNRKVGGDGVAMLRERCSAVFKFLHRKSFFTAARWISLASH